MRDKYSRLDDIFVVYNEKSFITLIGGANVIKLFLSWPTLRNNKLVAFYVN